MDSMTDITKPGSVSNQERQFMRTLAINVNLQQRGDGKAQKGDKTHLWDQELFHDLFLMCLTQSKLTVEGSGNADHDGDSSPMKCLMNMLGITSM